MQYFPLFFDLNHKPVLVVGGGEVATRKIEALLKAGANVTVVSPQVERQIEEWVDQEKCYWEKAFYSSDLLAGYIQVWATTDNPELNQRVCLEARQEGIMVNVVDDPAHCDFITPSMITRGRIQVAISSGGASPVLARNIRERVESVLGQNLSLLADFAASKRVSIKQSLDSVDKRRSFWEKFFALPEVEFATSRNELEAVYSTLISDQHAIEPQVIWQEFSQDCERMTLKSLRAIQQVDIAFYPQDCPASFLELIRRDAERTRFESYAQLGDMLVTAKAQGLRACVLVPENAKQSGELTLLMKDDRYFVLGAL
ncbi:siroheme synthase [Vibrio sp. SCSIO 43136]|uniref:precorrin-2 dehydrogenase/sirohydrochlorin ferrochelatase family protein n=1 Tax=Vibrio sp. SCSIO 43136 TaxID=2819101 RepID=UPI00207617B0|nr:siroheme synthase [Vibrio sp. SCSIO 43136]USD66513.1 siroheme synthase [Vibrio sp. SCSIO 43136]